MFSIYDGRESFFQWDLDRKLIVNDKTINEVHFCNKSDTCALVREVYEDHELRLVNVPNIILQMDWRITVYGYDSNYTKHSACFDVIKRSKPADYIYTETEVKTYTELEKRIEALETGVEKKIDYEKYFDIDIDGLVSIKPEYQANGEKNAELPEVLIIPDVINNIAVTALAVSFISKNLRVKSLTIPKSVTAIPTKFALSAYYFEELNGTENIEFIGGGAFQRTGLKKGLFPNLKELESNGFQFCFCANLAIIDIGNSVTAIPKACFRSCERLTLVQGGASVTNIGASAFYDTRSLRNLPFASNVTDIYAEAFVLSRVTNIGTKYSDWWDFYKKVPTAFNANSTAALFNKSKWWDGCTYTPCENTLGSTFNQSNPEWEEEMLLTDTGECADKWGDACMELSAIHICSALANIELNTPMEFMELLRGKTDEHGSLLTPLGVKDGLPNYDTGDMLRWFNLMGLECEMLTYNNATMQKVYDALADGALCLTYVYTGSTGGHANTIYGVADNGELLVLEPQSANCEIHEYSARTYQQPVWSLATSTNWVMIVRKK